MTTVGVVNKQKDAAFSCKRKTDPIISEHFFTHVGGNFYNNLYNIVLQLLICLGFSAVDTIFQKTRKKKIQRAQIIRAREPINIPIFLLDYMARGHGVQQLNYFSYYMRFSSALLDEHVDLESCRDKVLL